LDEFNLSKEEYALLKEIKTFWKKRKSRDEEERKRRKTNKDKEKDEKKEIKDLTLTGRNEERTKRFDLTFRDIDSVVISKMEINCYLTRFEDSTLG
jgi:hypothetical protein